MEPTRENWKSRTGFLMAAIGSAIGLGNIWRFNYLAYKNGGATFLIPYLVALLTAGLPILILEFGIGHKMRGAPPTAFYKVKNHQTDHFQGLGWWGVTLAMFGINLYYAVVISWCIRYFISAFTLEWGTKVSDFFFKTHLQMKSSMWDFTGPVLYIILGLALVWIINWVIVYKGIQKGIEKANKIFMPLLLFLVALLVVRGVTLEGAGEGIKQYLFKVDFSKLLEPSIWIDAYSQIFFTLSIGFGIMIAYSSYLPKKSNIIGNAKLTALFNCGFSLFAGFAVFGTLGYLAHKTGTPVSEVVKAGPGLAFITFPEAINAMKLFGGGKLVAQLVGIVFFLSLIVAGLSSSISLVEAFSSSVVDKFGWARKKIVTLVCILGFFGGIIFTLGNGIHWLDVVDRFMTNYGLVTVGFIQCLVIGWIYGARSIRRHINYASSKHLGRWFDICIKFITPVILLVVLGVKINGEIQTMLTKRTKVIRVELSGNDKGMNNKSIKIGFSEIQRFKISMKNGRSMAFKMDLMKDADLQMTAKRMLSGLLKDKKVFKMAFSSIGRVHLIMKNDRKYGFSSNQMGSIEVLLKDNKKILLKPAQIKDISLITQETALLNMERLTVFIAGFLWLIATGITAFFLTKRPWRNKDSLELGHHFEEGEDYHLH